MIGRYKVIAGLASRIWIISSLYFGLACLIRIIFFEEIRFIWASIAGIAIAAIGSLPIGLVLFFSLPVLEKFIPDRKTKMNVLLMICFLSCLMYGTALGAIASASELTTRSISVFTGYAVGFTAILSGCAFLGWYHTAKKLSLFFSDRSHRQSSNQINNTMETTQTPLPVDNSGNPGSGRILIKAIITGVLILVMLIPTLFITNLVSEREKRQQEVVDEVSAKWSSSQTLTGPYLFVPYKVKYTDTDGKIKEAIKHFWLLPDDLNVTGNVAHEIRPRSIYKVLLYKAGLRNEGSFIFRLPSDVDTTEVTWKDIKICFGLTDFKGIEERFSIRFNGRDYEFSPGLPSNEIDDQGLYASIPINPQQVGESLNYSLHLKLKGSEKLHFVPMGGNSRFSLVSDWNSPSFDGNNLPGERIITDSGFSAQWSFNKSNLPFSTLLRDFKFEKESLAFGVTLIQPADQYAKTNRSIKYAILFIGLTFSLFFIVELMQKKPVHPVQYVLIGIALVIFYTLLLSISEFLIFDLAYGIAAGATISLIASYAYGHFKSFKSALLFGGLLTLLYGFIFILIRLEDTALLVGSIGLFIVLAIVMFASRKVNWYGQQSVSRETLVVS